MSILGPRSSTSRSTTEQIGISDDKEVAFLKIMRFLQEQVQISLQNLAAIAARLGTDAAAAQQLLLDSIVESVLQSFVSRLRDSSSLIRRAARYVSLR